MLEDAERIARRFHEVGEAMAPRPGWETRVQHRSMLHVRWEDVDAEYRQHLVAVFDEMLRSELIFGGPSLYADPPV